MRTFGMEFHNATVISYSVNIISFRFLFCSIFHYLRDVCIIYSFPPGISQLRDYKLY